MNLKTIQYDQVELQSVKKDNKTYSVKFPEKIMLQTKRSVLGHLFNDEGDIMPFAHITFDPESAKALQGFESWVLSAAKEHKTSWFKKSISDSYLDNSFKTYFKPESGQFTAKVAEDFMVFSSAGDHLPDVSNALKNGSEVVLLLETSQITFGKTEFGSLWKLKQAVVVPPKPKPECMIQFVDDDEGEGCQDIVGPNPEEDGDENYFL
jgi:hypothetical protein